jgi:peptidoglycan/LPS O-acetylase OafA/YrhL
MSAGKAAQQNRQHLGALTGIRGVAAWMVVLYHIRLNLTDILPDGAIAALGKGYLAVDLFFMLSGFVLWYNYAEKLRIVSIVSAADFLWRRLARVWPLHLFILTLYALLVLVLFKLDRSTDFYPLHEFPLHVFLLQNWGWTNDLAWNHPAWSISTEFAAYLLFPLTVGLVRWASLPTAVIAAFAAALLLAVHVLFALNGHSNLGGDITHLGLWRCLLEFSLGSLLCIAWSRLGGSAGLAMSAGVTCGLSLAAGVLFNYPETAFVPVVFASALLALASSKGMLSKLLSSRPAVYLGEISYSTYLSHFLLFTLFKMVFVDASMQLGWAALAGFMALVLVASVVLYHLIEKPAQRWLNRHKPKVRTSSRPIPAE